MRNRRFGVELEFDSGGLGRERVAQELGRAFDREGLRRWYFLDRIHHDGSELELATPPLRGKEGFDKLKFVMDTLSDLGCDVTGEDGMHVHHDAPEFVQNIDLCIRLVKNWRSNRHLIYQFVSPDRTHDAYGEGGHWACPKWSDQAILELERSREIPYWDRNDLNLCALSKHGTIEIRLHEGTLDFNEASSWIKFGQKFIDHTVKRSMYDAENATHLLKKVRVNPAAIKQLENKRERMIGWR